MNQLMKKSKRLEEQKDVTTAIGNTPLIEISNITKDLRSEFWGKYEGANPGGSIKDRTANYLIMEAEKEGALRRDKTILEASSGNTAIALSMIARAKGYNLKVVMPESATKERRNILKAYGTEVLLTPAEKGTDGAIEKVEKLKNDSPNRYWVPNQYENEGNPLAHFETTGPEIYEDTNGSVDVVVAGMGTGGTLRGIGEYFREVKAQVKIIGVEPTPERKIPGLKNMDQSETPRIYAPELLDQKVRISYERAVHTARLLARKEGLLVGPSSGAALAGAMEALTNYQSKKVVVILPDRGERYVSTGLFYD